MGSQDFSTARTFRVLLVDDHEVVRDGLRGLIETHLQVVGEAGTVQESVIQAERTVPDVVVTDVRLADGNGIAGPRLRQRHVHEQGHGRAGRPELPDRGPSPATPAERWAQWLTSRSPDHTSGCGRPATSGPWRCARSGQVTPHRPHRLHARCGLVVVAPDQAMDRHPARNVAEPRDEWNEHQGHAQDRHREDHEQVCVRRAAVWRDLVLSDGASMGVDTVSVNGTRGALSGRLVYGVRDRTAVERGGSHEPAGTPCAAPASTVGGSLRATPES